MLIGFKCKHKNADVPFDECLKCATCVPRFVVNSIKQINTHDYHKGDVITATSLLGCLRETYLTREFDYYADIENIFYSWRGTLSHKVFEAPNLDNWLTEQRYEKKLGGITISGQLDGYDKLLKTLFDIKTIKDNGIPFVAKQGAKDDHVKQLSIYKWLSPLTVKDAKIVYISMSAFIVTGQHNKLTLFLRHKPRLTDVIVDVTETGKETYDKRKEFIVTYNTPKVKLFSKKKVEEFMLPTAKILQEAFTNKVIPPKCDEEMQAWKCARYCPVKDICDEIDLWGCPPLATSRNPSCRR
jgi:hypothetical protein